MTSSAFILSCLLIAVVLCSDVTAVQKSHFKKHPLHKKHPHKKPPPPHKKPPHKMMSPSPVKKSPPHYTPPMLNNTKTPPHVKPSPSVGSTVENGLPGGSVFFCLSGPTSAKGQGCDAATQTSMFNFLGKQLNANTSALLCVEVLIGVCVQADLISQTTGLSDVSSISLQTVTGWLNAANIFGPLTVYIYGFEATNNNFNAPDAQSIFSCTNKTVPQLPTPICTNTGK
ncbi:hypothetical protein CEUSTIGMA_g3970.t1 [Chlamydomonas eustigma]|uniref:Pherophorin domain-containing protein n=1 Tax=Chlamydomonas eustigma TaxID=1157962 RepID=A0A250X0A9_9CHLO|nr:hypothetical protein CEUSTIGMA_g3970.t1 [Chlamydomonas eustigma]|eukprot:GAX76524.1 hypothetical protein CEUSTIGMA_g3970.t1 [Chlamydomonas eustigma]